LGLLGVDAVMAAGISTLIDSGIEDIRTGKINEIDIEKGFEDAMLNFAGILSEL